MHLDVSAIKIMWGWGVGDGWWVAKEANQDYQRLSKNQGVIVMDESRRF